MRTLHSIHSDVQVPPWPSTPVFLCKTYRVMAPGRRTVSGLTSPKTIMPPKSWLTHLHPYLPPNYSYGAFGPLYLNSANYLHYNIQLTCKFTSSKVKSISKTLDVKNLALNSKTK